jgi:hypothetical protein
MALQSEVLAFFEFYDSRRASYCLCINLKKGRVYRIYIMYIMNRGREDSTCLGGAKS